jgi:hypothetical protein
LDLRSIAAPTICRDVLIWHYGSSAHFCRARFPALQICRSDTVPFGRYFTLPKRLTMALIGGVGWGTGQPAKRTSVPFCRVGESFGGNGGWPRAGYHLKPHPGPSSARLGPGLAHEERNAGDRRLPRGSNSAQPGSCGGTELGLRAYSTGVASRRELNRTPPRGDTMNGRAQVIATNRVEHANVAVSQGLLPASGPPFAGSC